MMLLDSMMKEREPNNGANGDIGWTNLQPTIRRHL